MATKEQLKKLDDLFKNGILDKDSYEAALKGYGIDIEDSQVGIIGDYAHVENGIHQNTRIDSAQDVAFAKDHGIAIILKHLNLTVNEGVNVEKTLHRYLTDLAAETNRLPWGRLSPEQAGPEQGESLRLSDVYTALDTTEPERMECEDDIRQCLAHQEKQARVSAQQMIDRHDRVVLLGDPGSGKTTFINFLTHVMARESIEKGSGLERLKRNDEWHHPPMFPLRIVLRDFAAWLEKQNIRKPNMAAFLRNTLEENGYAAIWAFIHEGLQNKDVPFLVLFDGLDEAGTEIRQQVSGMIHEFWEMYPHNRYVVTCRIYAYIEPAFRLRGFRQTILAPFSEEQIHHFIDAWYNELVTQRRIGKNEAKKLADRLKSAISRPDLLLLAQRPLIMTVMALLHTSYGQLPEDRVELYRWAVELLFRRWKGIGKDEKSLMEILGTSQIRMSDLEAGLYHAAFQAHSGYGHSEGTADIPEVVLLKQLKPYLGDSLDNAETFVHYIRERAGLLIRHKNDAYTFPHRTFQEFMAACHLTGLKEYAGESSKLIREDPDRWRIVFVLAAGHAARTHQLGNAIASINKLCPSSIKEIKTPDRTAFIRAIIAGEALLEIGLVGVKRESDGEIVLNRIKDWLLAGMQADEILKPIERVEAGNILSQLGDPRFDPENYYLPIGDELGFVRIAEGAFLMGSDKERDKSAYDSEIPHTVELSEYWMARYPVTVAQYKAFIEDTGYETDDEWQKYNRFANHPVVRVSWHDAVEYCKWLTGKLKDNGWEIRLPTEAQWEKAARGTDGRIYPWGDEKIDPNKANFGETKIGTTSPVGCFPKNISPYEMRDMAGNVWEWTSSLWGKDWNKPDFKYPYDPNDGREDQASGSLRVLRGGSWYSSAVSCRAAYRVRGSPGYRFVFLGFRLLRASS